MKDAILNSLEKAGHILREHMDIRTDKEHEENEIRITRAMADSSDNIVGNMRGMMKEVKQELIESFLEIQNGHHPLQAETVRA